MNYVMLKVWIGFNSSQSLWQIQNAHPVLSKPPTALPSCTPSTLSLWLTVLNSKPWCWLPRETHYTFPPGHGSALQPSLRTALCRYWALTSVRRSGLHAIRPWLVVLATLWWNGFSTKVTTAESLSTFRKRVKTHFFKEYFTCPSSLPPSSTWTWYGCLVPLCP